MNVPHTLLTPGTTTLGGCSSTERGLLAELADGLSPEPAAARSERLPLPLLVGVDCTRRSFLLVFRFTTVDHSSLSLLFCAEAVSSSFLFTISNADLNWTTSRISRQQLRSSVLQLRNCWQSGSTVYKRRTEQCLKIGSLEPQRSSDVATLCRQNNSGLLSFGEYHCTRRMSIGSSSWH